MAAEIGPFKTHRYLNGLRREGYVVVAGTDTAGTRVWNIYHPNWNYNNTLPNNRNNNPNLEYLGKVARMGNWPLWLRGKPWFYEVGESPTNQTRNSPVGQKIREVANKLRRESVRTQLPPNP